MTAAIIPLPTNALEVRINAQFRAKRLPFAAHFRPAPDRTVDDEYILTHNGEETGLTIQLEPMGKYLAIMETGNDAGTGDDFWLMQHSEYRRDDPLSMASFFSALQVLLRTRTSPGKRPRRSEKK
jgi:hypothetical protein